jgi:voltage-gated potassium channel
VPRGPKFRVGDGAVAERDVRTTSYRPPTCDPPQVQERWRRLTEWPLTGLALLFLAAYAWPIIDPDLPPAWQAVAGFVTTATWVAFALDYVVRLALARDRRGFVVTHLLDLAAVALPLLRPLRLLRVVMLLSVLNGHAGSSLRGRVVVYVVGTTSLLSFIAALAVLEYERRSPDANITTFSDALWWSLTTMTTVGYGDRFPVTASGRLVAAGLMIGGIALLGVVTATMASWLVQRVAVEEERNEAVSRREIAELTAEVRALRAMLVEGAAAAQPSRSTTPAA